MRPPPESDLEQLERLKAAFDAAAGSIGEADVVELFERGEVVRHFAPSGGPKRSTRGYAQAFPFGPAGDVSSLARRLANDTALRPRLELLLGGRILLDQLTAGRIVVTPFSSRAGRAGGIAAAPALFDRAYNYRGALLEGLGNLLSELVGSPAHGEAQPSHRDVAAVLSDPSLTLEDQVVLMLMLVMKSSDKKIKEQADFVQKLQANAQRAGPQAETTSIDVETMRLKRYIDKRSKMFDILRQVVDKYNQTAKNMIDSLGR